MLTYVHSGIFLETLNTPCIWSKLSAKKKILSIDRVVAFDATPKFWDMEDWGKSCKKRTRWTRIKVFPVGVDVMARCSLSNNFCASSSSWCCIIVENFPYLIIICSFLSLFCTSSSSSCCSAKASWSSLEITVLSSVGIDMEIVVFNSWRDLIYHLLGTDLLWSIFNRQFQTFVLLVLQQYGEDWVVIRGRSTYFDISICDIDLLDGVQCKCKHRCWFVSYAFLWTYR